MVYRRLAKLFPILAARVHFDCSYRIVFFFSCTVNGFTVYVDGSRLSRRLVGRPELLVSGVCWQLMMVMHLTTAPERTEKCAIYHQETSERSNQYFSSLRKLSGRSLG